MTMCHDMYSSHTKLGITRVVEQYHDDTALAKSEEWGIHLIL